VCVVQHIGPHKSILPALLEAVGPLPTAHPVMGEKLRLGRMLLAPPDRP
jgi:two-component system chemotaxis response regulator CheB